MALLFLLFWASVLSLQTPVTLSRPAPGEPPSFDSDDSKNQGLSVNSTGPPAGDPKDANSTGSQISAAPPLMPSGTSELLLPVISIGAAPESTTTQEPLPSLLPETSNATSSHDVPIAENTLEYTAVTGGMMTSNFQETSHGTSEPSVTTATNFLEPSNETSGFPVTVATRSLEPSNKMDGPPVTVATRSLKPSNETSVTMVTRSLEPSSGPSVTMATGALEPSSETSGLSVTIATSSLKVPTVASHTPVSNRGLSVATTPKPQSDTSLSPPLTAGQRSHGRLLVPVLVALLVVLVLLALLLLWRQRQKKRTGVLTLNRGGKRNGVVDAWAGPAQVPDEEAMTAIVGESRADKGSGVPETEGSGQRLPLTTFFGRRKSHQGSLALEELKPGSGPSLKGEEEPLVGSEDESVEAPTSSGPEVGDGADCK
ncbi:leukosialin [Perognathus longimembris pacificus]|uniref:leukosialin n=1 Tax=Perognathus longimembris pacificus TaxID=214514 RepID=UPI002018A76E|nr:leukosialin [Perognathus longimembris pacificus]